MKRCTYKKVLKQQQDLHSKWRDRAGWEQ